ncbi:hypothetical protein NECAME_07350, partial [Necator americanus]
MEIQAVESAAMKPSVGRVKPMPRRNLVRATSTPGTLHSMGSAGRFSLKNDEIQRASVRKSHIAETEARCTQRTENIEALRERVRNFLQHAAYHRTNRRINSLQGVQAVDETRDIFSHTLENPRPDINLQN